MSGLHPRVYKAPTDGCIVNRIGAAEPGLCLRHHERRAAHAFDATGDDHVIIARPNAPRGHAHGIHAAGAEPVHRGPRHIDRQPRQQRRHPCHVAVILARLIGIAIDHIVDRGPVHARITRHQRGNRKRRQIIGADTGQSATIAPDRRACRVADICLQGAGLPCMRVNKLTVRSGYGVCRFGASQMLRDTGLAAHFRNTFSDQTDPPRPAAPCHHTSRTRCDSPAPAHGPSG